MNLKTIATLKNVKTNGKLRSKTGGVLLMFFVTFTYFQGYIYETKKGDDTDGICRP